ncbi:hypothetical protein PENTCL1PPCAC_28314, partial [Pristionchus entomophagus]
RSMDVVTNKEEDAPIVSLAYNLRRKRKASQVPVATRSPKKEIKTEDDVDLSSLPNINEPYDFVLPVPANYIQDDIDAEIKKEELEECEEFEQQSYNNGAILDSALSLFVKDESPVPSTSKAPYIPIRFRQQIEKRTYKCGQCSEKFQFEYLLDHHYEQKHIVRSRKYPFVQNRPTPIEGQILKPKKTKVALKDARDDPTWRGHTMAEGCHYKHPDNTSTTEGEKGQSRQGARRWNQSFISSVKMDWTTGSGSTYMDCEECGERFESVRDHRIHVLKEHPDCRKERLCKNRQCVLMRELNRQENLGKTIQSSEKHHLLD